MFDSFFTDLGDMNQTGETVSEIDESAVWLQAFYRTLCHKTYFHIGYFCASFFLRFFSQKFSCGEDQTVVLFFDIKNLYLYLLVQVFVQIFHVIQGKFGSRDKSTNSFYICDDTCTDDAFYGNVQHGFVFF